MGCCFQPELPISCWTLVACIGSPLRALLQALSVVYEGKVEDMALKILEQEIDGEELHSDVVTKFSPIHSFLFDATGQLLFANARALSRLQANGVAVSAPRYHHHHLDKPIAIAMLCLSCCRVAVLVEPCTHFAQLCPQPRITCCTDLILHPYFGHLTL